jgi:hypothetical protein
MKLYTSRKLAGFTLAEMAVAAACFALAGGMVFEALNIGTIMAAKNYSVNSAHEETRKGVNRLLRDIHASVSVPYLIDSSFNAVTSQPVDGSGNPTGTTGVVFLLIGLGPNWVWQDPAATTLIMIYDNGNVPIAGQRLIVPLFDVEEDITKAVTAATSGHTNVFLQCGDETNILSKQNSNGQANAKAAPQYVDNSHRNNNTAYAITYYTDKVAYIVQNQQLKLYYLRYLGANSSGANGTWTWVSPTPKDGNSTNMTPSNWDTNGVVVARNITTSTPFSIPLNSSGTADNRYVQVNLAALEPKYSNRGFQATSSLVNAAIPYRSRLCSYQGINHCN